MRNVSLSRRSEDLVSARIWLAGGAPFADVLTMLEVRRRFELSPSAARAYAVEILGAVQHPIDSRSPYAVPTPKETRHAAA